MPCTHEVIGSRLARGIGRPRRIGAQLGEPSLGTERSVNLVRRDMMKTKTLLPRAVETAPIPQGGIQQVEGAHDVRFDKIIGSIDRAIDVAFRRQMYDGIRSIDLKQAIER